MVTSKKDLETDNAELRERLAEAEELLNAIRSGAVDGLLVETARGPQVYTLTSAEQPYRVMVETMREGAATLDEAGVLLYANPRLGEVLRTPVERLVGSPFLSFVDPRSHGEFLELIAAQRGQCECRIVDADGNLIPVNISISPIAVESNRYICAVITDLTALKQNEDLRVANAEAERVSRAKDEFMAMVSHELRTPMTSILGWASLVKISEDDLRLRETGLEAILQSAKIQARLIDDLLDMSRLESGKLSLSFTTLDLTDLVRRAIEMLRVTAKGKRLQVEEHFPEAKVIVRGDSNRLHQVVWNLLSNAFKFTRADGHVDVTLSAGNGFAELRVTDDGVGIHRDYLPRVFDRFSQADASTTRTFGGLGLGLAIVRQLVIVHGGTVEAQSDGEDRGATFIVRIPLAVATAKDDEMADGSALPQLEGITVLIVEDDAESREFLAATVARAGGRPLKAAGVTKAVEILGIEQPDVVVSDIALPGEDGLSFVRKLRMHDRERGAHTPAIAVSALGTADDRQKALYAGFDLFLEKPVQAHVLAHAVAETLPRR